MIHKLVADMNCALDNDLYFAALAIALMLPDICGRAEHPESSVGFRYKKWCDDNIGYAERCQLEDQEIQMPFLSGEVIYSLRCCFLHEGSPNIDKQKIKEDANKIDKFVLILQEKNEYDLYGDSGCVSCNTPAESGIENGVIKREYHVNVRRLCMIMGRCAEYSFRKNRDSFDFSKYSIEDTNMQTG